MHTFRKLPKASPRAKIVAAKRGSTLAKCPVCLDLAIICRVGTLLLRYEGDGTPGGRKWLGTKRQHAGHRFSRKEKPQRSKKLSQATRLAAAWLLGRKTENTVPRFWPSARLRTRIDPP